MSRLGPQHLTPPIAPSNPVKLTPRAARRFANATTSAAAPSRMNVPSLTAAGSQAAMRHTLAEGVPNSDPQRGHTPLRHSQFEKELANHPEKAWVSWLLNAIQHGVSLGYRGPRGPSTQPRNLVSSHQHPHIVSAELEKECAAGCILGPLKAPPFPNLKCSGVGVVPKKNGRWRMIHHLSVPHGRSINDFISSDKYSLHYSTGDDAISCLWFLGVGALIAKVDLKSAFRIVPVHHEDWELLGIHWQNLYYVNTCLPFGLRSALYLFNQFVTALHWILTTNYGMSHLIHYLDDYLLMDLPRSPRCGHNIGVFLTVCESLGIPVAMDKLEGPSTTLTFLGLELDSVRQEIRLPQDKLHTILTELSQWSKPRKTTKRRLLSLLGLLSFAARAIPAGRLFLRRLIRLSTTVEQLHHHIRLNSEAIADITWWQTFLPDWNGRAFFFDTTATNTHNIHLYTDASGHLGCGAYFQGHWFHHHWQPHQQLPKHISIQWQELFAIVAAALTWGHL